MINASLALSCSLLACLTIGVTQASARQVTPYVDAGTPFDGSTSTAGAFDTIDHLAVDQATHDLYVTDAGHGGVVDRFDPSGAAAPFPARSGDSSIVLGEWGDGLFNGSDVVVDNNGGATDGNVYVRVVGDNILLFGYDENGTTLPNFPVCGSTCGKIQNWVYYPFGLGLSPDGTLWVSEQPFVGTPPFALTPIDPATGARSTTKDQMVLGQLFDDLGGDACCVPGSTAYSPRRMVFDSNGDVYVIALSLVSCTSTCSVGVMKYDASGNLLNGTVLPHALPGGLFGGDPNAGLALDDSGNLFVNFGDRIEVYDPQGEQINSFGSGLMTGSVGVAVDHTSGKVFVTNTSGGQDKVMIFNPGTQVTVPDVTTGGVIDVSQEQATLTGTVDPDGGGNTTQCYFEYGTSIGLNKTVPCDQGGVLPSEGGPQQVTATVTGIDCSQFIEGFGCLDDLFGLPRAKGLKYGYRLVAKNEVGPAQGGKVMHFRNANDPVVGTPTVSEVNTDGAQVDVNIDPQGGDTSYSVHYGTDPAVGSSVNGQLPPEASRPAQPYGQPDDPQDVTINLPSLLPDTTYYYKVSVDNGVGTDETAVRSFHTFPKSEVAGGGCPNVNERQQTGAALLLDCRAYELVSAADTGGYNVESDLAPGQVPFAGFPHAADKVLYGVHDGGIPDSGSPTNRGVDPYIASRGADGWSTRYVGIPADPSPSAGPFASTVSAADAGLETFAFAGEDLCSPCFADGSTGIPVRLSDGTLVQGMRGSLPVSDPEPAGVVAKPLSADGRHLIFGSTQKFEPTGNSNGDVTIYDRDLASGQTQVASTLPGGATMSGSGTVELDVSEDGSRILIGKQVGSDAAGNPHYDLYMHIAGGTSSIAVADNASGVLYAGMSADGSKVYFTTTDQLISDTDASADLYRAEVSSGAASVSRVSASDNDGCNPVPNADGNHWNAPGAASSASCGVVAIAGGAGVASQAGSAYFLSPEQLDGTSGAAGEPNLYLAEVGSAPKFVSTLDPDDALVRNAVSDATTSRTADFQVNPSGVGVFATTQSPSGYENRGHAEVYRYSLSDGLVCVSCPSSNTPAAASASLASNGLSVTDDGRVFFNSFERLVLRDSNRRLDAYEWTPAGGARVQLISTGTSPEDASLMSVSADGTDALFFTREHLVEQDLNGAIVKLYDARENGGFFVVPPQQPCKASDECHGPGTKAAPPAPIQTVAGTDGQLKPKRQPKRCRKGFVKRHGKCVRRKRHRRHRSHKSHRKHRDRKHGDRNHG
jgi:hypothetical protein